MASSPQLWVSSHALWRARRRLGVRENWEVYLWAARAFEQGLRREEATGALLEFLNHRHHLHGGDYRVLEGRVFVFAEEAPRCLSILEVPLELLEDATSQQRVRSPG